MRVSPDVITGLGPLNMSPIQFTYLIKLVLETVEQIRLWEKRRQSVPTSQRHPSSSPQLLPQAQTLGRFWHKTVTFLE